MFEINEDTLKFLEAFHYEKIAIRTFSDRKSGLKGVEKKAGKIRCNVCGHFKSEEEVFLGIKNYPICKKCSPVKLEVDNLEKWTRLLGYKNQFCNHGVHLAVNGAHKDNEVKKVYAQFFEIDDKPMEDQWEIIKKLKISPSMIVKTRKSYHVYFLIKDGKLRNFRELQQRLAYTFGGDMQKSNESTCMRIPGFYHNKKEPIMVELVEYNPNFVYTQGDLTSSLNLLRLPPKEKKTSIVNYNSRDKDELASMVYSHIREYIYQERYNKILMSCLNPCHKDSNPSAVYFIESMHFYCSGCGYSKSLYEMAKEQRWTDITNYIEERKTC